MSYFIRWYKTGAQPELASDSLYWAYRTVQDVEPLGVPALKVYGPV